ncbi:MAG TPA: hypothetical protein VJM31_02315 [Vicinamibacterales bacterium]|nr:hypothetical protein [Vicinamibacterales bacterium]
MDAASSIYEDEHVLPRSKGQPFAIGGSLRVGNACIRYRSGLLYLLEHPRLLLSEIDGSHLRLIPKYDELELYIIQSTDRYAVLSLFPHEFAQQFGRRRRFIAPGD